MPKLKDNFILTLHMASQTIVSLRDRANVVIPANINEFYKMKGRSSAFDADDKGSAEEGNVGEADVSEAEGNAGKEDDAGQDVVDTSEKEEEDAGEEEEEEEDAGEKEEKSGDEIKNPDARERAVVSLHVIHSPPNDRSCSILYELNRTAEPSTISCASI